MTYYASKAEADDAWANAAYIPDADGFLARWETAASAFRGRLDNDRLHLDIPYGSSDREVYDLFLPQGSAMGLLVFIHGGYWIRFDKSYWSHLAAGALAHGWAVAMPSYDLCPTVSIAQITSQVTSMIETVSAKLPDIPISVTGHSAGGHLTARMVEDGRFTPDLARRFKAAAPISPVADLRPLLETSMNDKLRLDEPSSIQESPVLGRNSLDIPIVIRVGANERPVFVQQAQALARHWACGLDIVPNSHHFDIIDDLANPDSPLIAHLLGL